MHVVQGDTGTVPEGEGTFGSRSLQTAGNAVHQAASVVRDRALRLAGDLLESSLDDLVTSQDGVHVRGVPASALTWAQLAQAALDATHGPAGSAAGLSHEERFDGQGPTYPFGVHIAVVEVDRATGGVDLLRHVAVDDCGRIVDPVLVTGQQHGGIAQGVGQALLEGVRYGPAGEPLTSSLLHYGPPRAGDLPFLETLNTETPAPSNPLGAKGIGESGAIGAAPAVHNAVIDALSHLGVSSLDMPCTPQRIWEALARAS